ncbi:hypothetical protein CYMTET_55118 [Cymbomonas tetramitiformis]|uniref:RING-type domain-containing protein n=1 Tax=Cymbomonas tetramitiformis TaxID=36881 RepID=A0AAE0BFA6_9CHLO|nr:hypothetical protein CYMTET_55118 [Cymbomonas tetramitiformis]
MSVSTCMPMIKYDDYAGEPVKDDEEWVEIKRQKEESRDDVCSICLEFAFQNDENREAFQIFGCKHVFHFECIAEALKDNTNCPNCRQRVHPTDEVEVYTRNRLRYKHAFQEDIRRRRIGLSHFGVRSSRRKVIEKYDLVYEVYSALVDNNVLTTNNMNHVQADPAVVIRLENEVKERHRYLEDIRSRLDNLLLTMDDIECIRDRLKRYSSLAWFCEQLILTRKFTMSDIEFLHDDLDWQQLSVLYSAQRRVETVTVDDVRADLVVGDFCPLKEYRVQRTLNKVEYMKDTKYSLENRLLTIDDMKNSRHQTYLSNCKLYLWFYQQLAKYSDFTIDNINMVGNHLTYEELSVLKSTLAEEKQNRMIKVRLMEKELWPTQRELVEEHDLVYKTYSVMVQNGTLRVNDIQHVQADPVVALPRLKSEAAKRNSFMKDISSRVEESLLTMDDFNSVRDDLKHYNLLLWFCMRLIYHRSDDIFTFKDIHIVRDEFDDEQLKVLYDCCLKFNGYDLDVICSHREELEKHDLLGHAYKQFLRDIDPDIDEIKDLQKEFKKYNLTADLEKYGLMHVMYKQYIIPERLVTMNNIEQVREDLVKYNLVEMVYKESIIAGHHLTMDNLEEARKDLEHYELMTMAYKDSIIAGGYLTIHDIKVDRVRKDLKKYGLMKMAYKKCIISSGSLTMDNIESFRKDLEQYELMTMAYKDSIIAGGYLTLDNIESFRKDLEHYELMSGAYEEMVRRHDITEDNMGIVRQDLEKYNLISKVGPAIRE